MMLDGQHREAERLATLAGLELRSGDRAKALRLYRRAADQEVEAFQHVPAKMGRTRAALAISVVSLWYKGRSWEKAERWAYQFLADESYGPATRQGLKELLEAVLDEQALEQESKAAYSGEGIELRLKGGRIGWGTAPLDPLLHVYDGLRSLCYRTAEYVKNLSFRVKGLPIPAIREAMQTRTTQPIPGSYRLFIRFTQPAQLPLFEDQFLNPSEVSATLFDFIQHVAYGNNEGVVETVKNEQYRTAMLKLLRNIAPDGKQMKEVEFAGMGTLERPRVQFTSDTRFKIRSSLGEKSSSDSGTGEIQGTLRGLDLDRKFVDVTVKEEKVRVYANDLLLDDVVGPMVNQRVRLTGVKYKRTRQLFQDIELAEEQDDPSPSKAHP